jgi:hypothetical protein
MKIPPPFSNIDWKTYIIYAILNAIFIPIIYFFLVVTKGRSLEELDVIFAAPGDPVKNEQKMPHNISAAEARRILGLDDTYYDSEVSDLGESKVVTEKIE